MKKTWYLILFNVVKVETTCVFVMAVIKSMLNVISYLQGGVEGRGWWWDEITGIVMTLVWPVTSPAQLDTMVPGATCVCSVSSHLLCHYHNW